MIRRSLAIAGALFSVSVMSSVLAAGAVGCGGTTFGGLGGDDEDGGFLDDSGAGGDVIFPTDDTSGGDTSRADSKTTIDTATSDTTTTDSSVIDTGRLDAGSDTGLKHAGGIDSGIDSGFDSGRDDGIGDTITLADAGPDWPPTEPGKTGCFDTESSPAGAKQCANTCCLYAFLFAWHSVCADTCTLGRSYNCDDAADCTGGQLCCTGTDVFGAVDGSGCHASCGSDLQLCSSTAECVAGKTCKGYTPPDAKFSYGACQ